jgi:hypothetical protein
MRTWRLVLPLLLQLAVIRCGVPVIGRPTPAPPDAVTNPRNPAQRNATLAYAASLSFAEDTGHSHVFHGQYDRNLLDRFGTIGTVAPEIGMHRSRRADLHRGRIQLRVHIWPAPGYLAGFAPGHYGRLAPDSTYWFPPGISYVWVDSLVWYPSPHGDTAGTAQIVVIPEDTMVAVDTASIVVFKSDPMNQAIARWSPAQCWDCMKSSWCKLN